MPIVPETCAVLTHGAGCAHLRVDTGSATLIDLLFTGDAAPHFLGMRALFGTLTENVAAARRLLRRVTDRATEIAGFEQGGPTAGGAGAQCRRRASGLAQVAPQRSHL